MTASGSATRLAPLFAKAKGSKRIVLPESTDPRILQAAEAARELRIARPILVGEAEAIKRAADEQRIDAGSFDVLDPSESPRLAAYAASYSRLSKTPMRTARLIAQEPLYHAALALRAGDADGMLGGAVYTSGEFESVCLSVIGLRRSVPVPSSFFIMEIPGYAGGEGGVLLYADASVNPSPSPSDLATIALSTAQSAQTLLGWTPRVAMLSFSTKGSATHPDVDKVVEATKIARRMARGRGIEVDGELQADAALVPATAQKKMKGALGEVAGRANILVFPDLDAANTAYKLTQILARAKAYGPILQGFRRPLSDLSRGASVEDILGAIAIVALLAENWRE